MKSKDNKLDCYKMCGKTFSSKGIDPVCLNCGSSIAKDCKELKEFGERVKKENERIARHNRWIVKILAISFIALPFMIGMIAYKLILFFS